MTCSLTLVWKVDPSISLDYLPDLHDADSGLRVEHVAVKSLPLGGSDPVEEEKP